MLRCEDAMYEQNVRREFQRPVPPKWLVVIAFGVGILCGLATLALNVRWYGKFDRFGVLLYIFPTGFGILVGITLVLGPYQIWRRIRR
jgi:hypothetical protein